MYDVITKVLVGKIFSGKKMCKLKKHETADPSANERRRLRRPISLVEYVNTSYHTRFHQNM